MTTLPISTNSQELWSKGKICLVSLIREQESYYQWMHLLAAESNLCTTLQEKPVYDKVEVNTFAPMDPKLKYHYMRDLEKGLPIPAILYTVSFNTNYHYLWKFQVLQLSQQQMKIYR